jgi:hypothetical protein
VGFEPTIPVSERAKTLHALDRSAVAGVLTLDRKEKLSMCVIKQHAIKHMGSGGIVPRFLTSAVDGGEWSASRPSCLIPRETAPGAHV